MTTKAHGQTRKKSWNLDERDSLLEYLNHRLRNEKQDFQNRLNSIELHLMNQNLHLLFQNYQHIDEAKLYLRNRGLLIIELKPGCWHWVWARFRQVLFLGAYTLSGMAVASYSVGVLFVGALLLGEPYIYFLLIYYLLRLTYAYAWKKGFFLIYCVSPICFYSLERFLSLQYRPML